MDYRILDVEENKIREKIGVTSFQYSLGRARRRGEGR